MDHDHTVYCTLDSEKPGSKSGDQSRSDIQNESYLGSYLISYGGLARLVCKYTSQMV